jgi:hypothetical protein
VSPTLKKVKDWFKKNPNVLDQRRQITQIRERLISQQQRIKKCIEENTLVCITMYLNYCFVVWWR